MTTARLHKTARRSPVPNRARGAGKLDKKARRGPPAKPPTLAERVPRGATLRRQYVHCGKPRCGRRHGPYWYAFWKKDGKTRSAYVGSDAKLAELLRAHGDPPRAPEPDNYDAGDEWDEILTPAHRRAAPRGRR